jgi:hypothetical protein
MGMKFQIKYIGSKASEQISDENQRLLANACNTDRDADVVFYHKVGNNVQKLMASFTMLDVIMLDNEDTELRMLELVWDPDYNLGFVFVERDNLINYSKYSDENQRRFIDHFNRTPISRIMAIHKSQKEEDVKIEEHLVDFSMMTVQNIRSGQFSKLCIGWW